MKTVNKKTIIQQFKKSENWNIYLQPEQEQEPEEQEQEPEEPQEQVSPSGPL